MNLLLNTRVFNTPKLAKTCKKPYVAPKCEVIDMPDTPKLLATGRAYVPTETKKIYTTPSIKVYEFDRTPGILTTKPVE